MKLNEHFLAQMHEATELLRTSGPAAATAAIQRALSEAAGTPAATAAHDDSIEINPAIDHVAKARADARSGTLMDRLRRYAGRDWSSPLSQQPIEDVEVHEAGQPPGRFLSGSCSNAAGTRAYRLYVPSSYKDEPLPLIVMLHGCKQNPDDFAAGTGMNRLAEQHHCLVLYPAQTTKANGSNCWKWFERSDQQRDHGEPSILADMTRQVLREYRVDAARVYIAGLSAGGAMASVLAAAYPDLYAAVGIHSGLPVGSAHDVPSAFAAMKSPKGAAVPPYRDAVPAIVFHGDRDRTVHPANGGDALKQSMGAAAGAATDTATVKGKTALGRSFTQTVFRNGDGAPLAEHWIVHGSGHAWSGGSKAGSYTDPKGPDASAEMIRFFYMHAKQRGNA